MKSYIKLLLLICISTMVSACHFKSICPECETTATIMIKFDWSKIDFKPEGMTVLFYNQNDELVYKFLNVPPDGRLVNIESGSYYAVCYNNDTEYIQWRGEGNINTLEAYTNETELKVDHSRTRSGKDEVLVSMPDQLCGQCRWDVDILANDDKNQIVWFTPELLSDTYIYKFIDVTNSQYINAIKATLSGLRNGYFIAHPDKKTSICTMPFNANVDELNHRTITGHMLNFGTIPGAANVLTLYLWTTSGNFRATWDVTKQVVTAPDPHYVVIVIDDPIIIPEPIGNGGEVIDPSVDEWIDINEDIIL